jgi:cellobiose phosphorylase
VIAEVADCQRAEAVMDVVKERLEYKAGTLLLHPAYSMPDEKIGYLTRYAPGTRENGAVYTHAATWSVIAMAKMRRADDAYRIFSKLSPINRAKNPDEYCAEPYVTPGNIDGPDSKFYGRGGWTWYSGSAAWLWRAVFEWILGVRASENGLVIDPCIPARWKEYKVQRIFRGALFFIVIKNPLHKNNGVTRVTLNGNILENALQRGYAVLPEMPLGSTNNVEILLG